LTRDLLEDLGPLEQMEADHKTDYKDTPKVKYKVLKAFVTFTFNLFILYFKLQSVMEILTDHIENNFSIITSKK